jgi:hypothetical protein
MSTFVEKVYAIPISNSDLYDIDYIKAILKIKSTQNKRRVQSEKSYQRFLEEVKNTTCRSFTPKSSFKLCKN